MPQVPFPLTERQARPTETPDPPVISAFLFSGASSQVSGWGDYMLRFLTSCISCVKLAEEL